MPSSHHRLHRSSNFLNRLTSIFADLRLDPTNFGSHVQRKAARDVGYSVQNSKSLKKKKNKKNKKKRKRGWRGSVKIGIVVLAWRSCSLARPWAALLIVTVS